MCQEFKYTIGFRKGYSRETTVYSLLEEDLEEFIATHYDYSVISQKH